MKKTIDNILEKALIGLMAIMVINVLWQIVTRFILGSPSSWTEELARFLLIWIGLLGAALIAGKKMDLAIDILPNRLEGKKQARLNAFISLLVIIFALAVMVVGGIRLIYISFILGQISPALGISIGYVYLVVPLAGFLIVYYRFLQFSEDIRLSRS